MATTLKTLLSSSDYIRHPCAVSDIRGKRFGLLPLNLMLPVGVSIGALYQFEKISLLFPVFFFFFKCISLDRLLNFFKCFFCINWDEHVLFEWLSVRMIKSVYWWVAVKATLCAWDRCHLVTEYEYFLCCWIWFANILLGIFSLLFIVLLLSLYMIWLPGF